MDDGFLSDHGDLSQELQARFGGPAFVRRARQVQEAFDALLEHCRRERAERLEMVRTRLAMLLALAGGWDALGPYLADAEQVEVLRRLHAEMEPRLRGVLETTSSPRALHAALAELLESVARFNRRWRAFLAGVDLRRVNELRDGYNRYYLLEKECALRSPRLARQGYRPLDPVTAGELEALFPPLPAPRVKGAEAGAG